MDVAAVEKTRSYKTWMSLPDGSEFVVRVGQHIDMLYRLNLECRHAKVRATKQSRSHCLTPFSTFRLYTCISHAS
jgi:hypothetical protein